MENTDNTLLEKKLEQLELKVTSQETAVFSVVRALANLICEYQNMRSDLTALIVDVEADGNSDANSIQNIRDYLVKIGKFLHALDAKNTALASVLCREMNWDPDVMLAEYQRVVEDFGSVEGLIASTSQDSDST